jgi:glycosyltransferase involved in cell wall biosynthesis
MSSADGDAICILPHLKGLGGPASFASRLTAALQANGYCVTDNPLAAGVRALLIMGGTRRLDLVWRARRRGVRIVQRLNGMNWVHRKLPTGLRHYIKAESSNWILSTTRRWFAQRIIYQSRFTQDWWQTVFGPVHAQSHVIYNGVDLNAFSPQGPGEPPSDRLRILMVEAHLGGGMEPGLENAIRLLEQLNQSSAARWELQVAGDVPDEVRSRWTARTIAGLQFGGIVSRDQVPALDRSAHLLFSADLNAACPNAVVEALACGLPVIAFATGALPEMVTGGAGRVVPYGSNFWNLEPPVIAPLAAAAQEVTADLSAFRLAARARAEQAYNIDHIVADYLAVLVGD